MRLKNQTVEYARDLFEEVRKKWLPIKEKGEATNFKCVAEKNKAVSLCKL